MNPSLSDVLANAEQEYQACVAKAERLQRLAVNGKAVAAKLAVDADTARVERNAFRAVLGAGYLRLMNSGMSHRAFLRFVRAQQA